MPHFFFDLYHGGILSRDEEGTELPDDPAARAHAEMVARELLRNNENHARTWHLHVHDLEDRHYFDVFFSPLDETLAHLTPELRSSVEDVCRATGYLSTAISDVQTTLEDVKATLSSSAAWGSGPPFVPFTGRAPAVLLSSVATNPAE